MSDRSDVLIEAGALLRALAAGESMVLLDVRDSAADPPPDRALIAGAQRVAIDADFAGPPSRDGGRRPLPALADLQARARAWGLRTGRRVVLYDDAGGAQAARAWWTLRWAGVAEARLLDGGWQAAQRVGAPMQALPSAAPGDGDVTLVAGGMPTLDADAAAALARSGALFDARGPAPFAAGHIPGARNAPAARNLREDGRFRSAEEIEAAHAAAATTRLGVYCGSGGAAAHAVAALAASGIEAALYVGSWSAWSADPARPTQTGAQD